MSVVTKTRFQGPDLGPGLTTQEWLEGYKNHMGTPDAELSE